MTYKYILCEVESRICSVTLNRPDKHNALNIELVKELNRCFNALISNNEVNAVFLFGNQKAFCAGGDLKEMKSLDKLEAEKRSAYVQETFNLLQQIKVPVVTFIQGICFGGGLELALHADIRLCDESTRFALPEVKYGMIPGAGGTVQLPLQLGAADAAFYLLTGEELPLNKALMSGLIQKLIASDCFHDEIEKQRDYFNNASQEALMAIKLRLQTIKQKPLSENYKQEAELFSTLLFEQGHKGIENKFIKK